jgi:hypothetical protein
MMAFKVLGCAEVEGHFLGKAKDGIYVGVVIG